MKRPLNAVLLTTALLAGALPLFGASSLLTPAGVRYAIVSDPDVSQVQIARAEGEARATLVAPSTQDAAPESQAQLAYDAATDTLYAAWVREVEGNAEIRFASLNSVGQWSTPRMVAAGSASYRNLQFVISHAMDDVATTTLVHLAWWSNDGALREPDYAMFAYEQGDLVSAQVANLNDMAGLNNSVQTTAYEINVGQPPLAMARAADGVDIAFGALDSTTLTRLNVTPRKVIGDVRIWKPLGRNATRTPRSGLTLAEGAGVQGIIVEGRLALYSVSDDFRFVVLRSDGTWSEMHSVRVDDDNTGEDLVRDLRHTVQELLAEEAAAEPAAAAEK
ncbi:MAG: hypothetical protein ABI779_07990 [Acidobacteriota bacterium]